MPPIDIPYLACMQEVAAYHQLPSQVLPAIQRVEGGRVGMANPNTNGTEDLGVMQINTVWVQPLARFTGWAPRVVRDALINDACFNIAAAGTILRSHRAEAGGDLLVAIGNYHSRTPDLHRRYLDKVLRAAEALQAERARSKR
jgi:hypothetical protein